MTVLPPRRVFFCARSRIRLWQAVQVGAGVGGLLGREALHSKDLGGAAKLGLVTCSVSGRGDWPDQKSGARSDDGLAPSPPIQPSPTTPTPRPRLPRPRTGPGCLRTDPCRQQSPRATETRPAVGGSMRARVGPSAGEAPAVQWVAGIGTDLGEEGAQHLVRGRRLRVVQLEEQRGKVADLAQLNAPADALRAVRTPRGFSPSSAPFNTTRDLGDITYGDGLPQNRGPVPLQHGAHHTALRTGHAHKLALRACHATPSPTTSAST